ncbi:twin-arginine translocation signal domain-containing protein [bacterium]|nr:twin-arginine translocation signal domain-containing protein [bacterium]
MTLRSTRRTFLKTSALTGAALGLGSLAAPWSGRLFAAEPMKVLILGGTGQTGPHLVEALRAGGHTVTLFNRGNRSETLFPDVECLIGDRDPEKADGLDALKAAIDGGRTWDVCIDIWPHIPKIVETTADLLKGSVGHYCYVSSISVYVDNSVPDADESAAVGEAPNADETEFTWDLFGPFKAECENRIRRIYPDNHTIFRPGLIVGPRDFSFRGGYWPVRVRRGGEVLAPGDGATPIQIIDGRDLTAFQVRCMENRTGGTFDVTGPEPKNKLTMKAYLEECRKATGSDATFTWADNAFLEEHEVSAWMNMPCWLPPEGEYAAFGLRSCAKAVAAGLVYRPYAETIRDTLAWFDELPDDRREGVTRRAGLPAEKEAEVLAAWHEKHG